MWGFYQRDTTLAQYIVDKLTQPFIPEKYLSPDCNFEVVVFQHVHLSRGVVPGGAGVPCHTQILADQLTVFQPGGTDYAHLINTGTHGFSDLPTALASSNAVGSIFLTWLE